MKIGIAGDILLGDQPLMSGFGVYSQRGGDYGTVFASFARFAEPYDRIIGNFEGVLVDRIGGAGPNYATQVPLSAVEHLKRSKITHLSVANNHAMEYGPDRFRSMCELFDQGGIITFGSRDAPYVTFAAGGRTVGLLGFSAVPALYGFEPEYRFVVPSDEESVGGLMTTVGEARQACDYLIICSHWGQEFVRAPSRQQIDLARRLTDAGADLIAGAHPHVVQEARYINDRPVLFSLGNLVSDYWQERIRRNLFVELDLAGEVSLRCHELTCDRGFVIRELGEVEPFEKNPAPTMSDADYAALVGKQRSRVRREMLFHLARNAHKAVTTPGLMKWVLKRALFVLKNRRALKRNPDQVYSGPMH